MENVKDQTTLPFNKVLYSLFILFSLYQILVRHLYIDASASLGIALAFDPFDVKQPWNERPLWQKIWLFVHLAAVGGIFGFGVGFGDK
ncbi:MAG: hypothetical protein CFE23_07925 [Flavobacterium sp. BFFFF1]|uniref:hypothetical protein n=1 Tax=unclassified Flavobacterium TaxID=196869 RepID=UPI000BD740B1|nr:MULTISPECIES: hypothetical protein [unclassified Flavobacterium]OYU80644.1 MAG: hypothetical protein CFE23_07925 [Flavobacterium sp. BFFFF1]